MKRTLLLPIQAVTARARERVQREKSRKGFVGERESPLVMGLFAFAQGVEPRGSSGFPPMNLGENTCPHPSLQERLVLRACLFETKGWQANRLRGVKEKKKKKEEEKQGTSKKIKPQTKSLKEIQGWQPGSGSETRTQRHHSIFLSSAWG